MNFKFEDMADEELEEAAEELKTIESEIQNLEEQNSPFSVPKELDQKILKMIREFESIELKTSKKKKKNKYFRIAVILILCIGIGMTVVTMNVDAFRIKIFDFLVEDHGEYIDVNVVEKGELSPETKAEFPKEWENVFYPMALPEDFKLVDVNGYGDIKSMTFIINEKEELYATFQYYLIGKANTAINSENCEVGKTKVNGKEAIYSFKKDECIILMWTDSGYEFCITIDKATVKEAVKIAESVAYVKLK
nr:DUF4367 domain-containing protein [uncultured Aminipila sp.]